MNELAKKKTFKSADGTVLPYIEYKSKNEPESAIVLIYEIFGMTNHIHKLANTFAENGFIVNIPDIFSRIERNVALPYNREGFKKGISLKARFMYLFGPPGWSHDGTRKTSTDIKRDYLNIIKIQYLIYLSLA